MAERKTLEGKTLPILKRNIGFDSTISKWCGDDTVEVYSRSKSTIVFNV